MIFRIPFRLAEPLILILPTPLLAIVVSISALASNVKLPLTASVVPAWSTILPASVKDWLRFRLALTLSVPLLLKVLLIKE